MSQQSLTAPTTEPFSSTTLPAALIRYRVFPGAGALPQQVTAWTPADAAAQVVGPEHAGNLRNYGNVGFVLPDAPGRPGRTVMVEEDPDALNPGQPRHRAQYISVSLHGGWRTFEKIVPSTTPEEAVRRLFGESDLTLQYTEQGLRFRSVPVSSGPSLNGLISTLDDTEEETPARPG